MDTPVIAHELPSVSQVVRDPTVHFKFLLGSGRPRLDEPLAKHGVVERIVASHTRAGGSNTTGSIWVSKSATFHK